MSQEELSLQLECWLERLRSEPGRSARIHRKIGRVLYKLGRTEEAIPHLSQAVAVDPEDSASWQRLAHCVDRHGSANERLWVLSAVLEFTPEDWRVRERMIAALESLGRTAEAIEHSQVLAEAHPQSLKYWSTLARLLTDADQTERAIEAWRRVAAISSLPLQAQDRIEQLIARQRLKASCGGAPPFRVAILGNCQAYGLGSCLRALAPDAEVMTFKWADIRDATDAERLAARLEDCDAVLSHPTKSIAMPVLATTALERRVKALHRIPSIHFTGFHPDVVWLPHPPWKGRPTPMGAYHSGLAMACFTLGLPQDRTVELFNAFIYAALGYFEEYAKAVQYHTKVGLELGFDLARLMTLDGQGRPFVHVPNHPTIGLLFELSRQICDRLGISAQTAEPPPDLFAGHAVWPVYPEIARRIGCEGSLIFKTGRRRNDQEQAERELPIEEMVAQTYQLLSAMPADALELPRVTDARTTLKRMGV
jgi:tetratricopeptide (TPR) repeat protein